MSERCETDRLYRVYKAPVPTTDAGRIHVIERAPFRWFGVFRVWPP